MENLFEQMSIFDDIIPKFKIKNKIRLIEFFGGIGAQARSLEIIGASFEHHRLVEWAYNSYCSYNAIHQKDFTDYSIGKTKEEMIQRIKGTSTNYNEPLTLQQLNKKPIEWIKNAYNNCIATNNLINIMDVHAEDLGITEQDKYTYIVCYSFPCQDLSMAGKRAGMSVDGGTRSGLLWEVERILGECKEKGCLPQCLLLENVPQVMDYKNVKDWRKWVARLEELGYSNFADVLNAKDFGLPQNRKRCFMVSILGEWNYKMPKKMHLDYRLKDMLEKNVDEKYYLSEKMIEYVSATTEKELFTKDGNIKRYLDSDIVDKFEEGQMATTTYPNGYGHGTRVHNESIALNTIDRPVVKNNLRIRKLTPCECLKLMGFSRDNYQSLKDINMGDGAIYHMAGDSICTTVLCGIFSNLVNEDETRHIEIIKNYVRGLTND